jgi:hypothetical protein
MRSSSHVPLGSKDFGRETLIVNAYGHVLGESVGGVAKGRLISGVNNTGFLSEGSTGYPVGPQLELSHIGG